MADSPQKLRKRAGKNKDKPAAAAKAQPTTTSPAGPGKGVSSLLVSLLLLAVGAAVLYQVLDLSRSPSIR
jgi:hypothetical protein